MTLALMQARMHLQANAQQVAGLPAEEKRRRALRAIQERDLDSLWALVLAHLVLHSRRGAKISANTLTKYRQAYEMYWTWTEQAGVMITRPHKDAGLSYIRYLEANGRVRSTVGWHLASCKALYEALRWCSATESDPFRDVRPVADATPQHQKGRLYTQDQISALLGVANAEEAVVVLLGADCGLRVSEIMGLQRSHLHMTEEPPTVYVLGKGAKTREVPLSRRTEAALRRWLDMTPGWGPALLGATSPDWAEYTMKRLCKQAGVEYAKRTVHGLRRTAGTRLYEETLDLLETRDFLGHSSAQTTEVYVQYARNKKKPTNRDW
ncbi:tyrosine-type recombinase/integrase [Deinococcus sp. HMF7620]|uniref:Tyrosine-type recombinase/integrase n=1 Tax=Deinococcus arboris TaxID=2682977 RepID=A0A7C9I0E2_9DEIO|nr:site-specific integrase [Deinococcus arboris]MVN88330.1 tyrosine-type recombinase/integrase [Deinococcus arboris]